MVRGLGAPVVVKEVGFGLAPDVVRELLAVGVAAVDVAGAGGTSWSLIERDGAADAWRADVCQDFAAWGLPTATAIQLARRAAPNAVIVGSGGVRTGLDVAKAIALGADLAGIARPFLKAASAGPEAIDRYVRRLTEGLRMAMFAVGIPTIAALQRTDRIATDRLLTSGTTPG